MADAQLHGRQVVRVRAQSRKSHRRCSAPPYSWSEGVDAGNYAGVSQPVLHIPQSNARSCPAPGASRGVEGNLKASWSLTDLSAHLHLVPGLLRVRRASRRTASLILPTT